MAATDVSEAVFKAAELGTTDKIKQQLQSRSEKEVEKIVNTKTDGVTPLIIAALHGHIEVVKYLVESCFADVELKGSTRFLIESDIAIQEGSPLYYAAAEGHLDIVEFLIKNSAEIDSRTGYLATPLRISCSHGHYPIVKCLVENNSDVNQTNIEGETPLHRASYYNRPIIVRYLLEKGAQVISNNKGIFPAITLLLIAN